MAHSTGGGSRSGRHGSGGGNRHYRFKTSYSKKKVAGAKKYSYVDKHGVTQYFYASIKPERKNPWSNMILPIFVIAITIFASVSILPMVYESAINNIIGPKPLKDTEQYFTGRYIEDADSILDSGDREQIRESFANLREQTGIIPYIKTVYLEDLPGADIGISEAEDASSYYSLLDNYGNSFYRSTFVDESHMLIMYGVRLENPADWLWCQIQGDDVDPLISYEQFSKFQSDMQEYLNIEPLNAGEAISNSINNMIPRLAVRDRDEILITSLVMVLIIGVIMYSLIVGVRDVRAQKRINEYLDCPAKKRNKHKK